MKFRLMVDFDSNKWSVGNSTKLFDSVTELLHYTDASVESIDLRLLEDAMSCTKYCRPEFDEHSEECIKIRMSWKNLTVSMLKFVKEKLNVRWNRKELRSKH